ncbi:hypothetical protein [Streptomyces sp. NPDC127092]|uniref:hypothetical protein n=1 Tax=Streptomyces sp. NPDC127092 TaxID=3347135 RepID=UPI003661E699
MIRKASVVFLVLAVGTAGCVEQNGAAGKDSKVCGGATYEWRHEAQWVPIVLDAARVVSRGDELRVDGQPYNPWSATIVVDQDVEPPIGALSELSRKVGKPLASPGRSTMSEIIKMTTGFTGEEAQAVYFQAVERVDAQFVLKCPGGDRTITGKISTWNTGSKSFGTADCLKPLAENPENPVVKVAAIKRCPKDSVLVQDVSRINP